MKIIFKKLTVCILLIISFTINAQSQEVIKGLKQVFDLTLDDLGNADVNVTMKLNASQWDNFKKSVGNNTSIIKREMEKGLPKHHLKDFTYSEDQMERTYSMKFKALGISSINKSGKWEAKLDAKNPDITKLSEKEFVMTTNMLVNGGLVEQTQKIHLPANSSNAKIEKDSFGNAMLTFETSNTGGSKLTMYAGIALVLAGLGLFFKNSRPPKNNLKVAKPEKEVAAA